MATGHGQEQWAYAHNQVPRAGTLNPHAMEMNVMSAIAQDPLWQWSASSLAEAIREKRLSSQDVIQAHLDRIADVNHGVNADGRPDE